MSSASEWMTVGPQQLARLIITLLASPRMNVFVWGPPGVGKSSIIHQVAQALGYRLEDVRAVIFDPVDIKGLPQILEGRTEFSIPFIVPKDSSRPTLILLDELPNAPKLVQSGLLELALDKAIGQHKLPKNCRVIAAGNRAEDRAGAANLITSLSMRFIHFELAVGLEDWMKWAVKNGIDHRIRSYLRWRPDNLHKFDSQQRTSPNPRSWHFLSEGLELVGGNGADLLPLAQGCLGPGVGKEFYGHCSMELPDLDALVADPEGAELPTETAVQFALVGALVEKAKDEDLLVSVNTLCMRLPKDLSAVAMRELTALHGVKYLEHKCFDACVERFGDDVGNIIGG